MSQEITKDTEQYILNKSFDPDFNVSTAELLGHDSVNSVLRRIQVDASGNLKIDPTNLDSRYLKTGENIDIGAYNFTTTGDLTAGYLYLNGGSHIVMQGNETVEGIGRGVYIDGDQAGKGWAGDGIFTGLDSDFITTQDTADGDVVTFRGIVTTSTNNRNVDSASNKTRHAIGFKSTAWVGSGTTSIAGSGDHTVKATGFENSSRTNMIMQGTGDDTIILYGEDNEVNAQSMVLNKASGDLTTSLIGYNTIITGLSDEGAPFGSYAQGTFTTTEYVGYNVDVVQDLSVAGQYSNSGLVPELYGFRFNPTSFKFSADTGSPNIYAFAVPDISSAISNVGSVYALYAETGDISIKSDSYKLKLGAGEDAEMYVSSDDLYIKNTTQDKDIIFSFDDGGAAKTITIDASDNVVLFGDTGITTTGTIYVDHDVSGVVTENLIEATGDLASTTEDTTMNFFMADMNNGSDYPSAGTQEKRGYSVENLPRHNQTGGSYIDHGGYFNMGHIAEIPHGVYAVDYSMIGVELFRNDIGISNMDSGSWNDVTAIGLKLTGWKGTIDDSSGIAGTFTRYAIYSDGGDVELTDGNITTTGTITGGTLTDGTFSVTAGAVTGATGNISMWTNDSAYLTAESDTWADVVGRGAVLADNVHTYWGTGSDLNVYYDGTAGIFKNDDVTTTDSDGKLQFYGEYTPASGTGGTSTGNYFDGTIDMSSITGASAATYIGNNFMADMDSHQTFANYQAISYTGTKFSNVLTGNSTATGTYTSATIEGVTYDIDIDGTWSAYGITLSPMKVDVDITATLNASSTISALDVNILYNTSSTTNQVNCINATTDINGEPTISSGLNVIKGELLMHSSATLAAGKNVEMMYMNLPSNYEDELNSTISATGELRMYSANATNFNMADRDAIAYWTNLPNDTHNFAFKSIGADGWMAGDDIKWIFGAGKDASIEFTSGSEFVFTAATTRITGDLYVGNNADSDPAIVFDGDTNDGQISYDEDNDIIVSGSVFKAAGYQSSDGSAGITTTFTNGDGATVTVKNGLIIDIS